MKSIKISFTLISLLSLLAISSFALVTYAQEEEDSSSSTTREQQIEAREAFKEQQAPQTEERQEMIAERRAALEEKVQSRITNLAANMSNRMDAVTERFEQIITRMETRMEKLADAGVDVGVAESDIEDAKTALSNAKYQLETIDIVVADVVSSETPREAWKTARTTYQQIPQLLKEVRISLRGALASLKEAVIEAELGRGVSDAVRNENSNDSESEDEGANEHGHEHDEPEDEEEGTGTTTDPTN